MIKRRKHVVLTSQNPLKEWLGSDLDVKSDVDEEPEHEEVQQMQSEDETDESDSSTNKPGRIKARYTPNVQRSQTAGLQDSKPVLISQPPEPVDDSATEPDTESETEVQHLSVLPTPHKVIPPANESQDQLDSSATEPETDEELLLGARNTVLLKQAQKKRRLIRMVGSFINYSCKRKIKPSADELTEPDSETEVADVHILSQLHATIDDGFPPSLDTSRTPRPQFNSVDSLPFVGPFILDRDNGIQVNASINRWLREYQREGVKFFYERYKENRGGTLGDDMGLGKTIQVIAFLSAIMKKTGDNRDINRRQEYVSNLQDSPEWRQRRTLPPPNSKWPTCLVIVPSSVVYNWERELNTWGYFEVGIYSGSSQKRKPVLRDFELGRLDIGKLVTSFTTALNDIEYLEAQAWSCIFVDEAHRLKNSKSQTRIAFDRFSCTVRFGLTGTAIQNNYSELWNILDWSNPGRLGTLKQWNGWVTRPLTLGQDSKATPEQVATGRIVADRLVTRLLPHFFKRRTKAIIADQLPKKIDQVVFCPLTEMQKDVYKRFLNSREVQIILKKDKSCTCRSGKFGRDCHYKGYEKPWMFQYMQILIKISNHLALILPAPIDTPEQTQRHREQANIGWPPVNGIPTAPSYAQAVFDPRMCGKWKVLKDLLEAWRREGNNKVLIFTKSVKLLEMLEHRLKESFIEFRKLDGSTKQTDRMPMVDEFNEDPDVFAFLISIMAGGVGLNLVAANKVVIFDPNWNPAHDLQAQDRAFRFGQRRDVSVYRFLGAGSLEELIYRRQIYKQQLMKIGYEASHQTRYFEGVQGDRNKKGDLWGMENIFGLDESGTTTKLNIEKSHLAQLDWALTNLEGRSNVRKGEDTDSRGLEALFFDDAAIPVPDDEANQDEGEISKILNSNGVSYTHHNESLLQASAIETKLAKKAIESKKRLTGDSKHKTKTKKTDQQSFEWPPKRRRHLKVIPGLQDRLEALLILGYITSPEDLPRFATDFVHKSEQEQTAFLRKIDKGVARRKAEGTYS
ncbi:hypothetical protein Clacol_003490 [Clathrus columnatus]|uniref:Uncharacterized protein n=1 Tax=Clathrus columnatus TaxID=1419009 RepID=A0AAV5A9D4_9AGAM|nr:hypothetical protein Clacol_003490 [Clathrus columnatus]